ncbi:hypothetical protein [Ktedonobacter robiniae]|uniref:RNA polymerase sigma-70 region 4 domain-containing protein n=1 Tax=Ktedonobacter robiniae TaxID=2778365 RepID=A0ABQ3V4V8_9CHLR|nr:hypothetical protein [Ktedonobacter robiniae]GHO59992.1 hypothetical protein KSB_84670 [Ktedonobacter robiniae]
MKVVWSMPRETHSDQEKDKHTFNYRLTEDESTAEIRKHLSELINHQVHNHILNEQDALLLSLRLGLHDGKCYTLAEISLTTNTSRESLRQRQHLALQRKIKDPAFFRLLEHYSQRVKLPRGVHHHLRKLY